MFQRLHVCKICGKQFATSKGVSGHQRMHSGKSKRMKSPIDDNAFHRIWGLNDSRACSVSTSSAKEISIVTETLDLLRTGSSLTLKEYSFVTGIEQQELNEAAMNLVFLSEGGYDFANIRNSPPDAISLDLELKPLQEKTIHSVETKHDFTELLFRSGFDKSTTCSEIRFGDAVAQALPSSPRECKVCGKWFGSYQALGGHQRHHRSIRGKLTPQRRTLEDDMSMDLELKPMQDKVIHCVELKQDFSELLSHSGFDKSSTCSKVRFGDVVAQALPSSPRQCKICGKWFGCYQALGGHQRIHRSIGGKLPHERTIEVGNSFSGLTHSEAKEVVSRPPSFEVFQDTREELILL